MTNVPRPSLRTRSKKRKHVHSPGACSKIHYGKEKTAVPRCSICGQPLTGIPHLSTSKVRTLNRTKRRTSRPYGGHICSRCLKNLLKRTARTP